MRPGKHVLLLLLAAAIMAVGWLGHPDQAPVTPATAGAADLAPPSARNPAPDFTLNDLNGNTVRLSDLRGSVVLIGFWTTW